jgi:hypothetical protein
VINLSIVRLQEAVASEYPPGQVTLRTYDAKAILALLGVGPEPPPDEADQDGEDDWADDLRKSSRVSA